MISNDNNIPYDCIIAGEKQGSQEQFGRGATPMRFATNKKGIMTLKLMLITSITQITLVLYNNDEAGIIVLASSFCNIAIL